MKQVNVHQAKSQLSQLLLEVEAGEEVVIARAGKPVARLVPEAAAKPLRQAGAMKGEFWYAPDYEDADAEILQMFEDSINVPLEPGAKP